VDQDGNVLDILVQSRRNTHAAKRFFRKLLKGVQYVPRVIITDKLKSYGAAKREILPGVEHRQHSRIEQPGRKFTPTHASAREENAAVQIS
jgi:putative transposase